MTVRSSTPLSRRSGILPTLNSNRYRGQSPTSGIPHSLPPPICSPPTSATPPPHRRTYYRRTTTRSRRATSSCPCGLLSISGTLSTRPTPLTWTHHALLRTLSRPVPTPSIPVAKYFTAGVPERRSASRLPVTPTKTSLGQCVRSWWPARSASTDPVRLALTLRLGCRSARRKKRQTALFRRIRCSSTHRRRSPTISDAQRTSCCGLG